MSRRAAPEPQGSRFWAAETAPKAKGSRFLSRRATPGPQGSRSWVAEAVFQPQGSRFWAARANRASLVSALLNVFLSVSLCPCICLSALLNLVSSEQKRTESLVHVEICTSRVQRRSAIDPNPGRCRLPAQRRAWAVVLLSNPAWHHLRGCRARFSSTSRSSVGFCCLQGVRIPDDLRDNIEMRLEFPKGAEVSYFHVF